jgi:hypothetical protein
MSKVSARTPLHDITAATCLWTPLARVSARLDRDANEHPGSMQHFHTAGLVAEVLLKLHTTVLLSAAEPPGRGTERLSAALVRANGLGDWVAALEKASGLMRSLLIAHEGAGLADWLLKLRNWLSQRKGRDERESLETIFLPLRGLHDSLHGFPGGLGVPRTPAPIDLFHSFVGIRNKTTAHAAYGPEFWRDSVGILSDACAWLVAHTPLWEGDLVLSIQREGKPVGRVMRGGEPSAVVPVEGEPPTPVLCRFEEFEPGGADLALAPVMHLDPGDNSCYFANGHWRDADSSAEFLCQAIAAVSPDHGTTRIRLPRYALLTPLPESETHGADFFNVDPGRILNTLPPERRFEYVRRPTVEEELRRYLCDPWKRHIINVRGRGGVGKTSLVLHTSQELAAAPGNCPYDTIIWFSARDVDLTGHGPKEVRRATPGLAEVWGRVATLLGEEGEDPRQAFERIVQQQKEAHLLILDNFETFDDQEAAYAYLDEIVRPPTKIVITSRHYFRGDFQLPVRGMEFEEARELLLRAARAAGAEPLMTDDVIERIYERCEGHPYAMKLVASQVSSRGGLALQIDRVLRDDELLDALFRRSINDLGDDQDAVFIFLLIAQFEGGLIEPALRVITDELGIDLDRAVQALVLKSLVEVAASESGHALWDMPRMARIFARDKLLTGHLLGTQVIDSAARLRRIEGLAEGRLLGACESLARYLEERRIDPAEAEWYAGAARVIASQEPAAWRFVARIERAAGMAPEVWEESYKRAVESGTDVGAVLEEWAGRASTPELKLELLAQAVQADPTDWPRAARVAAFLVPWFERSGGKMTVLTRRSYASPAADALAAASEDLPVDAVASLAGLYYYMNYRRKAVAEVERGLRMDWTNKYLQNLALRMKLKVSF